MRQIGTAMLMYAGSNKGVLPIETAPYLVNGEKIWWSDLLLEQKLITTEVLRCPMHVEDDMGYRMAPFSFSPWYTGSSSEPALLATLKLSRMKQPSEKLLLVEFDKGRRTPNGFDQSFSSMDDTYFYALPVAKYIHRTKRVNWAYGDGHVAALKMRDVIYPTLGFNPTNSFPILGYAYPLFINRFASSDEQIKVSGDSIYSVSSPSTPYRDCYE